MGPAAGQQMVIMVMTHGAEEVQDSDKRHVARLMLQRIPFLHGLFSVKQHY